VISIEIQSRHFVQKKIKLQQNSHPNWQKKALWWNSWQIEKVHRQVWSHTRDSFWCWKL